MLVFAVIKIIKKLVNGPAIATPIFFNSNKFAFFIFLLYSFVLILNYIENPNGIISIFSGLNLNNIPANKCPNSCKKAKNIINPYNSICFVK